MINIELDGKIVEAKPNSTILEVALKEGKYIPHFCYHKKLSIAANCRMCLVEVEKSGKPLPACATPVTEGMKIHTTSELAVTAQKGVMEFLLINHPLDCPVCDQGGECQLQDLAVGYGKSSSRFNEDKRAVTNKDLGPLVTTEMTRCIHCSRCVRFTDEIAGFQELGMSYRNNHVEVMPFIGKTVDSEISGNIIDICPVGALLSKPFHNQARAWELSRRKSISPHDGLGSNLVLQIDKYHKVVRVLPYENEAINECWISDRDRFGYAGLYHNDRVQRPQIKQNGSWIDVSWEDAIAYAAESLQRIKQDYSADRIGVLANAGSTNEELYLLQKLMREFGVVNLDYRLDASDFSLDSQYTGVNYLGNSIQELVNSPVVLLVGSVIRQEQPILAAKLRVAVKNGMILHSLNVFNEKNLLATSQIIKDPREISYCLAGILKALQPDYQLIDLSEVEVSEEAQTIANSLKNSPNGSQIIIGEIAKSLPDFGHIYTLVQAISSVVAANFGILSGRANEVGAKMMGFTPYAGFAGKDLNNVKGLNAQAMLKAKLESYVLFNTELELDAYDSSLALDALMSAKSVIVFSAFANSKMREYADVILPIATWAETPGSFINMEFNYQQFNAATKAPFEAKPAWRVLRVLANYLNIVNFDYNTINEIRDEISSLDEERLLLGVKNKLQNQVKMVGFKVIKPELNRISMVSIANIYNCDSIIRRSLPLQQTRLAKLDVFGLSEGLPASVKFLSLTPDLIGFVGRFNII